MNLNSSSIARDLIAMSLVSPAILHRGACKTRHFCTALVGPPLHVQNFWRPNPVPTKNLQPHHTIAHHDPSSKTPKSTSATHFCIKAPGANVQNSRAKSHASGAESQYLFPSTFPSPPSAFHPTVTAHGVCLLQSSPQLLVPSPKLALHAQNPGAEFCAPIRNTAVTPPAPGSAGGFLAAPRKEGGAQAANRPSAPGAQEGTNYSNRRRRFQLASQPLPGDVQPPLDRADRRRERLAHLHERLAAHIKRFERVPIQLTQPRQAAANLHGPLVRQ